MRCDQRPFTSKYVRQAIAFTLDRPAIIKALFDGDAVIGNDNPFYPGFKSYNSSVGQRSRTSRRPSSCSPRPESRGASDPASHRDDPGDPALRADRQAGGSAINVDINLTIETPDKYYGMACSASRTGWTGR